MNKFNKKGFTLIEMLVVIAIIAVLVSIIIPTVSSATDKAAAATNAANLRSLVAEATTKYLTHDKSPTGNITITFSTDNNGKLVPSAAPNEGAPKSKACGVCQKDQLPVLTWNTTKEAFEASYDGITLEQFQQVAAGEVAPRDLAKKTS